MSETISLKESILNLNKNFHKDYRFTLRQPEQGDTDTLRVHGTISFTSPHGHGHGTVETRKSCKLGISLHKIPLIRHHKVFNQFENINYI